MDFDHRIIAGSLIFFGGILCILGIIIAESLYPGYSTSKNYISDLGVGPSALIFNSSVVLLGLMAVIAAYLLHEEFHSALFSINVTLAGVGAIGVGIFTEHAGVVHTFFSLITFLFAGLSAVNSYKLQKFPLSYFFAGLGVISLSALILFGSDIYLGLGKGGMERMIAYPSLIWSISFGSSLIGSFQTTG